MALIKCIECGKEFSDKASACIHCGCPIEESEKIYCEECGKEISNDDEVCKNCGYPIELVKEKKSKKQEKVNIKSWEELTQDEKRRVLHYRKVNDEYYIGDRTMIKTFAIIEVVLFILSIIGFVFLFIPWLVFIIIIFISSYKVIPKQDKEWYDKNKERVYKEKYLPL